MLAILLLFLAIYFQLNKILIIFLAIASIISIGVYTARAYRMLYYKKIETSVLFARLLIGYLKVCEDRVLTSLVHKRLETIIQYLIKQTQYWRFK